MLVPALLNLVALFSLRLAVAFPYPSYEQQDLCSLEPIDTAGPERCIAVPVFYRELAYDIAAEIAERTSQLSSSAIKGCSRGIHWHSLPSDGSCLLDAAYDEVLESLDSVLKEMPGRTVCQTECVQLSDSERTWELLLLLGTSESAVLNTVSQCDSIQFPVIL